MANLFRPLGDVVYQLRRIRSLQHGTIGWSVLALLLLGLLLLSADRILFFALFALGSIAVFTRAQLSLRQHPSDEREAALLIEKQYPELDSRLLTAIQQKPSTDSWQFGYLQTEVLSEVLGHARHHPWKAAVPASRSLPVLAGHLTTMGICLAMALAVTFRSPSPAAPPSAGSTHETPAATEGIAVSVEPGDTEIERGRSLLVIARFPGRLPTDVHLVVVDETQQERRIPLRKSLDDPLFGGRVPNVERDLTYRVEFDGQSSESFSVTTFDYPQLLNADARVDSPAYTGLPRKTIEDVRRFSVVEGAELQLECKLNKPVRSAVLIDEQGTRLDLTPGEDPRQVVLGWTADLPRTKRYRLELVDEEGRRNRDPEEFLIQVLPNRLPDLKVSFPSRDTRVSPLEEVVLEARASDDFGLVEYGLIYQAPDGTEETVVLGGEGERDEQTTMDHLLALEALKVEPDQLVSYYFYADDVGPDGSQRRAFSDMFFAEVRPFEEIFRQAPAREGDQQGQEGEQGGEGGPSQKLVELQRQIVTATWNLIRRERGERPSSSFEGDVRTLIESQAQVEELAGELADSLTDPLMQQYAGEAVRSMAEARKAFESSADEGSPAPLPQARGAAQQAYQALLRLNSREKLVQLQNRNQQGGSAASSGQDRFQQQLQELELKNDRNRYQTERQAQQQRQQAERETLQALNRLRELARRQGDLNEKIRELENELRQARSEEERKELERQLKRLQEEQQEMLRNLDDLRQRMDQEENRQRMADAREQVDQTRERLLRASEALKEGQTSRALTEGTRARRELDDLKEEFRRRSAGQFDEAVRQLRDDVQDLAQRQEDLGQKMRSDQADQPLRRPSLRDDPADDRKEVAEQLRQQQQRLGEVLDRTRELVEDAEVSEPLLSKKLYDAVRDLRKYQPEESLDAAAQLTRFGITDDVRKAEEQARQGIDRLKQGVDDAARSILGDESEALRLAQGELEQLTEAVRRELDEKDAPSDGSPGEGPPGADQDQQRQERPPTTRSEPLPGESPSGRSSDTQSRPESSDGSQGQPGQPGELGEPGQPGEPRSPQTGGNGSRAQSLRDQLGGFFDQGGASGGEERPFRPLSGEDFQEWSDRMRDIEEMLTTPELRAEAAAIRDRARQMRIEMRRHARPPNWELVRTSIYGPMVQLQERMALELARRNPEGQLVPIDRDPVPDRYADLVRRYYEQLSRQPEEMPRE